MRGFVRIGALGAFAAGAIVPAVARAAPPFDMLGADAETAGVANATVAYGKSIGVLATNPALLPGVDQQAYAGFVMLAPRMHVRLAPKPPGTNIPLSIYDSDLGATPGVQQRSLPTVELGSARGDTNISGLQSRMGMGFVSGFGIPKFRFGALAILPLSNGSAADITTHYDDERESAFTNRIHFMRFGEWQPIIDLTLGAGYEIAPQLRVGASVELSGAAVAHERVYIPDASVQSYASTNLESNVSTKLRPILGARWTPIEWFSLGLAWRNASYFRVDGASEVTLWNQHEPVTDKTILKRTTLSFPIVFGYEPMQLALAAGVERGPVTAQVVATWQRWSAFLDHHGTSPQDAAVYTQYQSSDPTTPSPYVQPQIDPSRYAFKDVVALQGGATLRYARDLEVSAGAAWYPSPVPAQIGRTNYADNDIVGLTLGHRYAAHVLGKTIILSASLQLWVMLERTTNKDVSQLIDEMPDTVKTLESKRTMPEAQGFQTSNPGFPGYRAGGWLSAASLSLAYPF